MKSSTMFFKSLCSLALLCVAQARYTPTNMADSVDFQTFELDGHVQDMIWCGSSDETILVQTTDGSIYRSRDRGQTWKRLRALMEKQGQHVADQDQDIGKVHKINTSPVDDSLVVFLGTNGINWVSEDCGANIKGLNSGKKIQEYQFHPTMRDWALASSWTSCAEFGDEPCRIYKELYFTLNLGEEWQYMANYVFDFEWGTSELAKEASEIPNERIFYTRDPVSTGHQGTGKKVNWSMDINLYMSDDFALTETLVLEAGNTIVKTPQYMFIAVSHSDELRIQIYSSTYRSGFTNMKKVRLPRDAVLSSTFTLMDTQEDQVFLFLENHGLKTPFGNLYISDADGRAFSLSMENIIKGQAVDFERVTSLDGTFIANKYDADHTHDSAFSKRFSEGEFDEADMIAEEERKEAKSRMNGDGNRSKKQVKTERSVNRIEDSVAASEVQDNVRTYITHNKGAKWELLNSPKVTSKGKAIDCYTEDDCSLHLEIYSHQGELAPVYSVESAVGIVLGTGNLGKRLTENSSSKNLYISRDGGLNWKSVKQGTYIYEIGDHGAIIVAAQKDSPVRQIEFSWDEGKTWETLQIADEDVIVENIIIEPNSISQQFMVYGSYAGASTSEDGEAFGLAAPDRNGFLTYLDFSALHEPQCKGADNAGAETSDYELWSPYDGRHGDNKCFLGQQVTYVRRKQDSLCFNGEDLERVTHREACSCSDMDFECDVGYHRAEGSAGTCQKTPSDLTDVEEQQKELERQNEQCAEFGYYEVTQGYRKIPGDICTGGLDVSPYRYDCNYGGYFGSLMSLKGFFMTAIFAAILYIGWPIIEAVLILLPIPDPTETKDRLVGGLKSASAFLVNIPKMISGGAAKDKSGDNGKGYEQNFDNVPGSLADEDDEDEEDIGKDFAANRRDLNYDSDEKDLENDNADGELIALDSTPTRKAVPKLRKPE